MVSLICIVNFDSLFGYCGGGGGGFVDWSFVLPVICHVGSIVSGTPRDTYIHIRHPNGLIGFNLMPECTE